MEFLNHIRAFQYLTGVLTHQQRDLFCGRCSAWNNTLNNTREDLGRFEAEHAAELGSLPTEVKTLLAETRTRLAALANVSEPAGQKKAGNCKLPQGVCFVKHSRAILEKV